MGLLPIILIIFFGLWQMALTGFTYVVAGHAAREGARQLAVDSSDTGKMPPYREAARKDLPGGWREHAKIEKRGDVTVSVRLKVPVLIPAFRSPIDGRHAPPTPSSRTTPLPDRQIETPEPKPMKRLLTDQRGQASAELIGMLWWMLLCALIVWQLLLAAWTVDQAANAARTASRVEARGGDAEKAARYAVSQGLRKGLKVDVNGETAKVSVRIPIIVPGPRPRAPAGHAQRHTPVLAWVSGIASSPRALEGTTAPRTASATTAGGCSRRSTSTRSPCSPRSSGARAWSASSAGWSRARGRSSPPPNAPG